ncbi:MAG: NAD(P)H-binding protein [Ignavibacteriaceae bacterium]|nr:NAD(P)H-binding protein [Ignavibacteriaceae bacterium]
MKKIAFIGATGMLGKPVAEEFINAGYTVNAMVRSIEKAKKLLPQECENFQGDLQNEEDLNKLLKDSEIVYLNLALDKSSKESDFQPERDGIDNILKSAKKNGTKRIMMISSIVMNYQGVNNFDWWVFRIKHECVKKVKNSGIPYTIFYPSSLMETFNSEMIQNNRMTISKETTVKNWWISCNDYGKQVVKSLELTPGNECKEYTVQGPVGLTMKEAATLFVDNYSKAKIKISYAPMFALKIMKLIPGKFNYLGNIVEALIKYNEKFTSQKTWDELGKPTTTIEEYAKSLSSK